MLQELKFQLSTAILTIATVAAAISAGVNFQQQLSFHLPDDGVTWVDHDGAVQALRVAPNSGADNAGLRRGDILRKINGLPIVNALYPAQVLVGVGVWNKADYLVERGGVQFKAKVIVQAVPRDPAVMYQYLVGVGYLVMGLFVYFRRGSAQRARHFYVFCLVSFVFSAFHYTGKLNGFDSAILFGNVAAGLLAPTLFLHFCLTFPEPRKWLRGGLRVVLLYLPAAALMLVYLGFSSGVVKVGLPLVEQREILDRIWMLFLTGMYLVGAVALSVEYRRTDDPIVRQQLKWLRNGAFSGILPFALFYVLPYTLGIVPNAYMKLSVLTLALVPLTLAYAIIRYRLMDVDILFRRGYAYTLATLCVLAGFYGIVFFLASLAQKNIKDLGQGGLVAIMMMAAFLFQPVRNWIQERLDRYFYRDRYDYRQNMVEFARELSSETDLDTMLSAVAGRLRHTLYIRHLAFFLADESAEESAPTFRLKMGVGLKDRSGHPIAAGDNLDLTFLDQAVRHSGEAGVETPYLFFGRTRYMVDAVSRAMPASERQTISDLDLTYYLPCAVRGRTIAFVGVSRTEDGDFLSSVDLELLQTLSGYVGIAIENARLYRSLQHKVEENERLKEFSENIVESINVGILAVDLEDRVESWNTQVEQLTGIRREKAVGRTLAELLPAEMVERFARVRGENGIHHIYKFILRPAAMPLTHNGALNGGGKNGHASHAPKESTLNIAIAPLISKNLEQIGRLIIFDDVTDRAELERRLVQADKLSSIGLLAAGVAHEVNTPLAVISTYAQMLAKQVADDDQKSKLLEKIAKQTFRASEIVNSLLNFSRTSTTEFGEVSINRVIQETLSLLDHQMKKAGLDVRTDFDAGAPGITGNPGKLQQVFLNLFINARDAMAPGGILEVKTSHDDDGSVRIDVIDSGHGIDPENIHRIYDPFFTTKGAKKGTGLGLSVTYGIIQEHGGAIQVFSRPGGGTRFHLEFPLVTGEVQEDCYCLKMPDAPLKKGHILVIDDEADIRESLETLLTLEGYAVDLAPNGGDGLRALDARDYDLVLLDLMMPDRSGMDVLREVRERDEETPIFLITAFGSVEAAVDALKSGANDYFSKPWDNEKLLIEIDRMIGARRLERENRQLKTTLKRLYSFPNIIGQSERMLRLLDLVTQVASSRSTILITGETGTGKELIARAIHANSPRADNMFMAVNSGSLPHDLLESTLFGHSKGAFTSAIQSHKGYFEIADRGTIFFDEIGTISAETQGKLLRVIQEREFMPLGSSETIKVDVRIVAATNADLKRLVDERKFREDLYYRLNVINIALPPLRERKDDIPLLVEHFFTKFCRENDKFLDADHRSLLRFHPDAMQILIGHSWPGNVRELENVVERAVVLASDEVVPLEVLPEHLLLAGGVRIHRNEGTPMGPEASLYDIVADFERRTIVERLEESGWSQTEAADSLHVPLSTLNQKIKRLNIDVRRKSQ